MRSGSDYLKSLNDGRQVFVDGEKVADVTKHPAFREAARSVARLYDIAAAPENRELMTFPSPKTGEPVQRACQIPKTHADLRARRLFSEKWAEATFGLMGRSPDHVAGFFAGYAAVPERVRDRRPEIRRQRRLVLRERARRAPLRQLRDRPAADRPHASPRTSRATRRCMPAW